MLISPKRWFSARTVDAALARIAAAEAVALPADASIGSAGARSLLHDLLQVDPACT